MSQSLSVGPTGLPPIPLGATLQFTATGNFSDGTGSTLATAKWVSSNAGVISINVNTSSATGAGTAVLTATSDLVSGTLTVTVSAAATYYPGWRNVGLPSLGSDGKTPLSNPPPSCSGSALPSDRLRLRRLAGRSASRPRLHDVAPIPVIARKDIILALSALPAGAFAVVLQASRVADQIEMIKITPSTLGREEMAWLWTALKADYRPTFPFQVSVVLMEPELQLGFPLLVLSRNIVANPVQPAQLLQVVPPDRQISAAPGDTVTVTGIFLKGATKVSLTNPRLGMQAVVPASWVTNNSLQFFVPIETPLVPFPAGIYDLAVLFTDPGGDVAQTAGPLPVVVAPIIQIVPPPLVVKTVTDTLVTLTFSPLPCPTRPSRSPSAANPSTRNASRPAKADSTSSSRRHSSPAVNSLVCRSTEPQPGSGGLDHEATEVPRSHGDDMNAQVSAQHNSTA